MKNLLFIFLLMTFYSFAGPTKVGNGDDGEDLEGFIEITHGQIYETRKLAVLHLKKLNTSGIPHLGALLPELEHTRMYMTKRDIGASQLIELGAFHANSEKLIYARTFSQSYAATRFFPAANSLDQNQLIALHIHEALHRSLPEAFRENETVVSNITLAIVTPMTTHDQVRKVVEDNIDYYTGSFKGKNRIAKTHFEISHLQYGQSDYQGEFFSPLKSATKIHYDIYPFRDKIAGLGLGVEVIEVEMREEKFISTIGLYSSFDLYTINGFDISIYGLWNRDSGNGNSVKTAYMGRDGFRGGILFEKEEPEYLIKNYFEYSIEKEFDKTYNEGPVRHDFGSITKIRTQYFLRKNKFNLGIDAQVLLFGHSSHRLNNQLTSTDRSTIINFAPTIEYKWRELAMFIKYSKALNRDGSKGELKLHDMESEGLAQDSLSVGFNTSF